jgi:hypothetical protein
MMGLLSKFISRKQGDYCEAGTKLVRTIADAVVLDEWRHGLPQYTPAESEAISKSLSAFQRTADSMMGGKAVFHPEIIDTIQRKFTAEGLEELAGQDWKFSDRKTLPTNWKSCVSTYLKAWLCNMNPQVLLDMATMLAKAGYKEEAKQTYEVVLLFPNYAPRYFGNSCNSDELVNVIVEQAQVALHAL